MLIHLPSNLMKKMWPPWCVFNTIYLIMIIIAYFGLPVNISWHRNSFYEVSQNAVLHTLAFIVPHQFKTSCSCVAL